MTERAYKSVKITAPHVGLRPGQAAFSLMSILSLALMLRNSDIAIRHMTYGLRLCAVSVIPSLFPFMVISELIVSGGAVRLIGRLLARPFRFLFGIGKESSCALLLGLLCGFPVGTRCAVSLYRQGVIDKEELSHLLCFSNIPSSAFLISTVGTSLFGDHTFGVWLYVITVLSALLLGFFDARLRKRKKRTQTMSVSLSVSNAAPPEAKGGIAVFTEAIGSSALAMVQICAFVVFFSVFVGALEHVLSGLSLSPAASTLLFGLFEMTGGVSRAASLASPAGELLCVFFVGWSGISVHCQFMNLCNVPELSFRSYWLAKLAHGGLNVLLFLLTRQILGI